MDQITVTRLAELDHPVLVDVREADEYAGGHAPGARNVPLSRLDELAGDLPTDRPVHVICQAGGRSAKATQLLTERGVPAVDVAGGTSAWIEAGLPVARP